VESAAKSTAEEGFAEKILSHHNHLRKTHGDVPALVLDPELSSQAKHAAQAKVQDYITNKKFTPQPDNQERTYNDNTWVFLALSTIKVNASRVLEDWSAQGKIHDFHNNIFDWKTAHFTQMVWKSTEKIGVDFADGRTSDGKYITIVVVRYYPAGNVLDKDAFADNVHSHGSHGDEL